MGTNDVNGTFPYSYRNGAAYLCVATGIKNGSGGLSRHEPFEVGAWNDSTALGVWHDLCDAAAVSQAELATELQKHTDNETGLNGKTWFDALPATAKASVVATLSFCSTNHIP